jgi:hypothetical protein
MKITEARIKEIISEERSALLTEQKKTEGVTFALREIALQSSALYDNRDKLSKIDEADLKKIKLLAENLDSIFYRVMNT